MGLIRELKNKITKNMNEKNHFWIKDGDSYTINYKNDEETVFIATTDQEYKAELITNALNKFENDMVVEFSSFIDEMIDKI